MQTGIRGKIWLWIGGGIVASLILFAPYMASSIIKGKTLELSGFTINADRVNLSWLGPQNVEKIHGKSTDLGVNFDIDSIESDRGLLSMLTHFSFGKVTVEKPVLYIQPRKEVASATESSQEEQEHKVKEPLKFPLNELDVREGSVRIVNPDGTLTRIDQTNIQLQKSENIIKLHLRGSSQEGEHKGFFSLESSFDPQSARNLSFIPLLPYHFTAKVDDFPTKVIDAILVAFQEHPLGMQEWIGPNFNFEMGHEKNRYQLNFSSANLNGKGVLEQEGEIFKAIEPLSLHWTIYPEALNPLLTRHEIPLELYRKTDLNFQLYDLIGNPVELKSSFKLQVDPATFVDHENNTLKLDQLSFESKVNLSEDERKIAGAGQFYFNDTPFSMTIEGTTLLEIANPVCFEDCLKGQWNILLDKAPMKLVELLVHSRTPLEEPLGPTLSLAFNLIQKGNDTLLGVHVQNQALESDWLLFSLAKGTMNLKNPVQIKFSPLSPIDGITLTEPLLIDIKQLNLAKNLSDSSFKISIESDAIGFEAGEMQHNALRLDKKGQKEMLATFETELHLNERLSPLFGSIVQLSAETAINIDEQAIDEIDPLILKAQSDRISLDAKFKMDRDFKLTPLSAIQLNYTLTPALVPNLAEPTPIKLKIFASNTSINLTNIKDSRFKGLIESPSIKLKESGQVIALDHFESTFSGDLSTDWVNLSIYGTSGSDGLMDIQLEASDLFFGGELSFKEACYKGKGVFENFPSLFFEPLLKENELLFFMLGKKFDAQLEGVFLCNQDPNGLMGLHFKSDHLDINTRFKMDEKSIRIFSNPKEDNKLVLHISKDEAARISPELKSGLNASVTLDYIAIPNVLFIPTTLEEFVDEIEGMGQVQTEAFLVNDYQVPSLEGGFECKPNSQPITLEVHHKDVNEMRLRFVLDRPLRALESWSDLDVQLNFFGKNLPLAYFAAKADVDETLQKQIRTLFDNAAEIQLNLNLNESRGPIDLSIQGTHCEMEGSFFVEESVIRLQKPLVLTMEVTPEIGKNILGEIVPLLGSVVSGNGAIQITIEPDGFQIPVNQFKKTSFNKGTVDIGILTLTVDKEIEEILSFLKFNGGTDVEVWATPVYFSLKNQVITLERFDFLVADRFPMSLWGTIDFLKDNVNIKIGLGAKTLDQVFEIKHLPSDFMLPVSLKGPFSDVTLDKAKATAKIAALIAESKGSPEGVLLGNLLQLLSGSFKEEPAPPPTTNPLPWDSPEEKREESKSKQQVKDLLKGLLKKLSS